MSLSPSGITTGDCVEVMATLPEDSVDAIVTDPPYNLGFMGKAWDQKHQHEPWATAALRVAKPGAYLLAFGGTRTFHRLACAIEDAGWIIRDTLVWAYASGFPKGRANLKPAWEPIVMARKPGPLRPLAIDECRIGPPPPSVPQPAFNTTGAIYGMKTGEGRNGEMSEASGRWPANVILTDAIFDGDTEGVVGGGETVSTVGNGQSNDPWLGGGKWSAENTYGDTGTYSRFFLIPKSSRSDREPNDYGKLVGGLEERIVKTQGRIEGRTVNADGSIVSHGDTREPRANVHPTVKPTELMRHLVRLVTPAGGTVLDPFLGSGTTAIAAEMEGFEWIGIEKEPEYVRIAEARLAGVQRGMGLTA